MQHYRSRFFSLIHWAAVGLIVFTIAAAVTCSLAQTHSSAHHADHGGSVGYQPPYAAIVVDANSGRVLHASNPDSLRHPASITKIMTLYLLFEQLEAGKLKLGSRLTVSPHAAAQEPSKLGLEPGQTIAIEDAIKAVVTKSANDIAVVIAEAIGGSEEEFARLMTRKAHALGMTQTVYTNASGLPDDEQVTTARDQALLGRVIQDRFPRYYRYFATSSFHFHGMDIRNHNNLLGHIQGVDGIKTGYTRASGFNLVSSVRRGGRYLVAVVFGGSSGGARDARMRDLIEEHIAEASTQRTVAVIAKPIETEPAHPKTRVAVADPGAPISFGESASVAPPRPGSAEPIQPIPVKTITVRPRMAQSSALGSPTAPAPQANVAPQLAAATAGLPVAPQSSADPNAVSAGPAAVAQAPEMPTSEPAPPARPTEARPAVLGTLPVQVSAESEPAPASAPAPDSAPANRPTMPEEGAAKSRSGWVIQLGAYTDEADAKRRLRSAQSMAHSLLAKADGFTERLMKASKEFYRARFAGFDKEQAEAACHYLRRKRIDCVTLRIDG